MSLSSLLLPGGFALLAGTGAVLAGLGGPAAGALGAVKLGGVPGVVTGLMPLVAAGALGVLGRTSYYLVILSDFWLLSGVSSMMCIGPAYCTTTAGQCCLLIVDTDRGALICPLSC